MQKICLHCQQSFEITDDDLKFYDRIHVPKPTWCPDCRHMRRHGWINDLNFFSRKCDQCQKKFISIYPADSEYIVYCRECWYSDQRNDTSQGRDYDFSRSFFEQFDELMHDAPQLGIIGQNNENCDYCESIANCKNCYLISECSNCEDCCYSYWIQKSQNCLDSAYMHECETCYEVIDCVSCYNLRYSQNCQNCSDSYFLEGCVGCKNCLFSTNLRHKQYYIFNKPYSKEAYFDELKKMELGKSRVIEAMKQEFQKFLSTQPRKYLQIENTENCSGNYIRNAKNCRDVFHCYDAEDCAYGEHIWRGAKDCMDANTAGRNAELIYESTNSGINSYGVKFSRYCWGCHHTEYSNQCKQGKNLFGCVSLKPGAKYCILNKQYSPDEYQHLVVKIKEKMRADGEYGEFFPLSLSLFGYNTTVSFLDFPFSQEEILAKGWKWTEQKEPDFSNITKKIPAEKLPNTIQEIPDDILNWVIICTESKRPFKIQKAELEFYRKMNLPIPRLHPDIRHQKRMNLRNPRKLWERNCMKCEKGIQTSYSPERSETVYCEECYLQEVY